MIETLNVSLTFTALCAASLFLFACWIGPLRGRLGVLRGDGGDPVLFKRIRIHGNFMENAPMTAAAFFAAEALGAPDGWLWVGVASFFTGRLYHYLRFDGKDRGLGHALTTAPALVMAVYIVLRVS